MVLYSLCNEGEMRSSGQQMERKMGQATLRGEHGGEVLGWVRPGLSGEKESVFREHLLRQRFEHVDEYLALIDECLRKLRKLGALDAEAVEVIREARSAVTKLHSMQQGSDTRRATAAQGLSPTQPRLMTLALGIFYLRLGGLPHEHQSYPLVREDLTLLR